MHKNIKFKDMEVIYKIIYKVCTLNYLTYIWFWEIKDFILLISKYFITKIFQINGTW